ncbi:MAG: carboxypeptidase-like regulatory domain-containing protein [Planctomycetes bacterium]|jgi:hypothetical protein|nr:carboxypeptidase-like regulatory domain-containing protein [Planctomycetota bacterium]
MNARLGLAALLLVAGLAIWFSSQREGASLGGPVEVDEPTESVAKPPDRHAPAERVEVEGSGNEPDGGVREAAAPGPEAEVPTIAELRELARPTEPGVVEGLVLVGRTPLATGGRVLHVPGYFATMRGPGDPRVDAPEPTTVSIDGNGEFRLHGLARGRHTVAVDLGRGPRQATSFEVVEGERGRRIVIVLGTARVFGQLWDPEGRALTGVRVTLSHSADRSFVTSCVSAVDGRYVVEDLPAGEYWFVVEPKTAGGAAFETMQKISLAVGEVRRLDVGSPSGAAIVRGRVLLRNGSQALGGGHLHLRRKSDRAYSTVAVDATGAFSSPVAAGEYEVSVSFRGCDVERWQAADLAVGRADVAQDFVVAATQVIGSLTATATGLPPEAIDRSHVYVQLANGGVLCCLIAIDRKGRFVVGGLHPGRYQLALHPAELELGSHEFEVGAEQVIIPLTLATKGR